MKKTDIKDRRAVLWIPIYGYRVTMTLGDTLAELTDEAENAREIRDDDCEATLSHHKNTAMIRFQRSSLSPGVIAHETFHLTHRIMEWIENDLTRESHEPHAYLCQFITDWIYRKVLKDWKEKLLIP